MNFRLKILFFVIPLLYSNILLAQFQICIDAYSSSWDPFSGHASIAFKDGNRFIAAYGYYPEVVGNPWDDALINYDINQLSRDENYYTFESRGIYCRNIDRDAKTRADNFAREYLAENPNYSVFRRHCGTFAVAMYEELTGEDILSEGSPYDLSFLINQNNQEEVPISIDGYDPRK